MIYIAVLSTLMWLGLFLIDVFANRWETALLKFLILSYVVLDLATLLTT